MTFREAIIEALRSARQPLSTREVADSVMASGKVTTQGKTPDATVGAVLYSLLNSPGNPGVSRLAEPGPTRAKRGSVRWAWDPKMGQASPSK